VGVLVGAGVSVGAGVKVEVRVERGVKVAVRDAPVDVGAGVDESEAGPCPGLLTPQASVVKIRRMK
jgi:hypothetical protein